MKNTARSFLSFVFMALIMLCARSTSTRAADVSLHQSRYIYCNVYLDYACFGIASGDDLNMKIPGDFVVYSISLGVAAKAQIYSGNNPQEDAFKSPQVKHCSLTEPTGKCLYVKSSGAFDLLYQADANAPFIHLHMTGIEASNTNDIDDFLANFRSCKPVDQSVHCTNDRIFKSVTL